MYEQGLSLVGFPVVLSSVDRTGAQVIREGVQKAGAIQQREDDLAEPAAGQKVEKLQSAHVQKYYLGAQGERKADHDLDLGLFPFTSQTNAQGKNYGTDPAGQVLRS